jgi:heme-degrading monooxygenase HmoA
LSQNRSEAKQREDVHELKMFEDKKKGRKDMQITKESTLVTFINVFETTHERQQEVIDSWLGDNRAQQDIPGFIAAALLNSLDGTRVVNYTQWRSQADLDRFEQRSQQGREARHTAASRVDPHVYEVVYLREQAEGD